MIDPVSIGAYTPEDAREIKQKVLGTNRNVPSTISHTSKNKLGWHYGILKEDLDPVCDSLTEYTQATASVLMYTESADNLDLEEVTEEDTFITLTNRSPYLSLATGDLVLFRWVIKEWAVIGSPVKRLQAVMQEDLATAIDVKDDPSVGKAKVLIKNTAGDLKLTTLEYNVVNRFLNISIDAGTYIKIEYIDGEWQPYAADCPGSKSFSSSNEGSSC